ncbi:MAG: FkbM family methyltransferase [Candidatus Hydrogenedentota bacterium]
MSIKLKVYKFFVNVLKQGVEFFGRSKATHIYASLIEELSPVLMTDTPSGMIKFFCPNRVIEWRANTLLTKEPETIEWIDTFANNETLWDIGANIGVYSLYAALKGLRVLAFEPAACNYYILNKNIEINKMSDRISSFCFAFNDLTKIDNFYMSNVEFGGAEHVFAQEIDWKGEKFLPVFKQATIGFTMDEFIDYFNPQFPNYIKIDVDGIEDKIIKGAYKTLKDDRVKSILVELNIAKKEVYNEITDILKNAGFSLVKRSHSPDFDNTKYSDIYNCIFSR